MREFIIFDLEASCWKTKNPLVRQEIIEIGAYRINSYYEINDEFDCLIQPSVIRGISNYCTQLTGIKQNQLDSADRFPKVFKEFKEWAHKGDLEVIFLSWGKTDLELIQSECRFHRIDYSWFTYHDLKTMYKSINKLPVTVGLARALKNSSIPFEGTMHNALDDSFNLTRLVIKLREDWVF